MAKQHAELEAHITQLESALAHHQHEYELLNQVVIDQGNELGEVRRRVFQLEAALQRLTHEMSAAPDRDPIDERPPHY